MSNYYDTIMPFDGASIDTARSEYKEAFTPLFQAQSGQPLEEEQRDLEGEMRKIFEDAYKEGEKAGYEFGMRKADVLIKRLNDYLMEVQTFKKELVQRNERLCVELAILFAEAIILREYTGDRDIIREMIRKGLELCEDKSTITIRMRKEDADYIRSIEQHLTVITDDTLREPGFIIETDLGTIDGRISVQINELKKRFLYGD